MGFWDWIKGRKAGGAGPTTAMSASVSVSSGHVRVTGSGPATTDPVLQEATLDEVDHLAHELLSAETTMGPLTVNVNRTTSVIVDGQAVDPADPRAAEAIREATARLRAQGFDELAGDLERRLGAAAAATGAELSHAEDASASVAGQIATSPTAGTEVPDAAAAAPETPAALAEETPSAPSAPSPPADPV